MTEQIKRINNPLTIIAIFAALAEVNATVAIGLIDKELHVIFIWFVIGFPTILVILFFITLNFNTKVMYSPSDYRDDKTFLDSLYGNAGKKIILQDNRDENITKALRNLENKLLVAIEEKQSSTIKNTTDEEVNKIVDSYKEKIKNVVDSSIKQSSIESIEIPEDLKSVIKNWIAYPAYLPIINAIYNEGATSISDLKKVEKKYNLPSRWDTSGVTKLLTRILDGTSESFNFSASIALPLYSWIKANEPVIKKVTEHFANFKNDKNSDFMDEARLIAQNLKI